MTCVAQDQCHTRGFCNATDGACSGQAADPDGTPCAGGVCFSAICKQLSAASAIPTSIDPTIPTDVQQSTAFLYQGPNASQIGVASGTIVRNRAAVLRGKVLDTSGQGIMGASILVVGRPEYGVTVTGADGMFNMAVNGGEQLRLEYQAQGFLPIQRTAPVHSLDYSPFPDVVMTQLDPASTIVSLAGASSVQTALATPVTDDRGTRRSVLMFFPGTQATVENNDGSTFPITTLTIHSTELTVGSRGPKAMPALLPPSSGYTYAAELRADEAIGGNVKGLSFNQPVVNYVDNFLHFPAGTSVPAGYYDPSNGSWIPDPNGRVIKILSILNGVAQIDADGDGIGDSANALAALGITPPEQSSLATLYSAGATLWRVPTTHFTYVDYNWPVTPPPDSPPPDPQPPEPENDPDLDLCDTGGTIVNCNDQVLGERASVVGAPFALAYTSARAPGYAAGSALLNIPLSGPTVPANLTRIELQASVAGQGIQQTFPPLPNQSTQFSWLGTDPFGRRLVGLQFANVQVTYVYETFYQYQDLLDNEFPFLFGQYPSNPQPSAPGDAPGPEVAYSRGYSGQITLVYPDAADQDGLGGWALDIHNSYDPKTFTLTTGGGKQRPATPINVQPITSPNTDLLGWDILPAPDGSLYISNVFPFGFGPNIISVSPTGVLTVVAANVAPTYLALSGKQVIFAHPVLAGPDQLTGVGMVERVNADGTVSVIAGSSSSACQTGGTQGINSGDEGLATNACVAFIDDLDVAPDGQIYLEASSSNSIAVRRIDAGGVIHNVLNPTISAQYSPGGQLAIGPDYSIYLLMVTLDGQHNVIKRLLSDGTLASVAGTETGTEVCADGDGSNGIRASTCRGLQPSVGPDGSLYLLSQITFQSPRFLGQPIARGAIVKLQPDGRLAEVFTGLGSISVDDFKLAPNGDIIAFAQIPRPNPRFATEYWGTEGLYRLRPSLPGIATAGYVVPAADGTELYSFDTQGRHLKTLDGLTSTTKYQFGYDPTGYVNAVTDRDGRVTSIQRDGSGHPTAIVSPAGQQTALAVDPNGYLASVTSPGGAQQQFQYSNGLLTNEVDARGGVHQFTYDLNGRLQQDHHPSGGGWTLSDQRIGNTNTVTMTSGEGHSNVYGSTKALGGPSTAGSEIQGNRQRSVVGADGLARTSQLDSQDGSTVTSADGMVMQTTLAPDPRFGMAAPYIGSRALTTPGGVQFVSSQSRTAVVAADGVTLISQLDTVIANGNTMTRNFDNVAHTATVTSFSGRHASVTMDDQGRLLSSQTGNLASSSYNYDTLGRLSSVTVGSGPTSRVKTYSYDSLDRPSSITDPQSLTSTFGYDSDGHLTSTRAPDQSETTFAYDLSGDLASLTPPTEAVYQFLYTPGGDWSSYIAPLIGGSTATTSFTYNLDRQRTLITRPDSRTISLGYDGAGRPSTTNYDAGTVTRSYSTATGQLSTVVATDGGRLDLAYDGNLALSSTWSGTVSGSVVRTWNNQFLTATESVDGGDPVAFGYDPDGLLTSVGAMTIARDPQTGFISGTTLGGVSDSRSYNEFGDRTHIAFTYSGNLLFDSGEIVDKRGRVSERTETEAGTTHTYDYGYDPAGRLTQVSTDGIVTSTYVYDQNGNRLSKITGLGTEQGTYDARDRLLTYGTFIYTYTEDGELASKRDTATGSVTTYGYDALGNLRQVRLPDGRLIDYLFDGMNRRIGKKINGQLVKGWLYRDSITPAAELDGLGNVVVRLVSGGYEEKGGAAYRIVKDRVQSARLVVDTSTGNVAQQVSYDEFGRTTANTSPGFQTFGFAGGVGDDDTGLIRFGGRDYDPYVGRWIEPDPILFGGGQSNLYTYVDGDPINGRDPTGRQGMLGQPNQTLNEDGTPVGPQFVPLTPLLELIGLIADLLEGLAPIAAPAAPIICNAINEIQEEVDVAPQVVIGEFPDYVLKAQEIGAGYFDVGNWAYQFLTGMDEAWSVNQAFLQDAIAKGAEFVLATPIGDMSANGVFVQEVGYILSQGYVLNAAGTKLIPLGL